MYSKRSTPKLDIPGVTVRHPPQKEGEVKSAMTRLSLAILGLLTVAGFAAQGQAAQGREPQGTIAVSGAWALYPMVVRWSEGFNALHPKVRLDISAGGAGKGMADVLGGMVDVGMVSRDIYAEEVAKGAFWVAVTRDAVFPTTNSGNPVLADLMADGLTKKTLEAVWITGTITRWGWLVARMDVTDLINVYTRSDACGAAKTWAKYLGYEQEDLQGIGVYGDPGVAMSVARDPLGLGYNNLSYAYDPDTGALVPGIVVLPIDVNENGSVDPEEGPYDTKAEAVRAVARGWYPSPPSRDLNLVTLGRPSGLVKAFITWVLTDGQRFVPEVGYIPLSGEQLEQQLEKLE
jgi:phosphate transport system substrate-binding protein